MPETHRPSTGAAAPEANAGQIADFGHAPPSACTFLSINGAKLAILSTRSFPLSATVKVVVQNRMWIGEVWACESTPGGFRIEIEVDALLNDIEGVSELAARFRHERTIRTREK